MCNHLFIKMWEGWWKIIYSSKKKKKESVIRFQKKKWCFSAKNDIQNYLKKTNRPFKKQHYSSICVLLFVSSGGRGSYSSRLWRKRHFGSTFRNENKLLSKRRAISVTLPEHCLKLTSRKRQMKNKKIHFSFVCITPIGMNSPPPTPKKKNSGRCLSSPTPPPSSS